MDKRKDALPDWNSIAEKFEIWLPLIKPVSDAMLATLQVDAGDKVLDVASGTGEPAISLAKQTTQNDVEIKGVDAADAMVGVANNKVKNQALTNIEFFTMPAEKLDFDENTFDKAICRFGVMLFDDPKQGVQELYRVLKPGAQLVLAVWGEAEKMTSMKWSYQAFKGKIPDENLPPHEIATSLGIPGAIESLLENAGFSKINVERCTLNYQFENFDEYWNLVEASEILKQQFEVLPESQQQSIKNEISIFASDFTGENGLVIPHEYLLVSAAK